MFDDGILGQEGVHLRDDVQDQTQGDEFKGFVEERTAPGQFSEVVRTLAETHTRKPGQLRHHPSLVLLYYSLQPH
jgi:hypothetical protein